jgi:hypothetical protein
MVVAVKTRYESKCNDWVFSSPLLMSEACRLKVCFVRYLELFKNCCVVVIRYVSPLSSLTYRV